MTPSTDHPNTPSGASPSASQVRPEGGPRAHASQVRPSVPPPLGTDALGEPLRDAPASASQTRDAATFNPGTVWLITDRTRDAWTAVLHLLADNQWHAYADVHDAMWRASNLADQTINNHLRSASRRGWITSRRKRIKLRDRHLIEAALDEHRSAS